MRQALWSSQGAALWVRAGLPAGNSPAEGLDGTCLNKASSLWLCCADLDRSVLLLITLGLPPDRNCAPNRNSSEPDSYGNEKCDDLYIAAW